jgi:hypothetical protein
MSLTVKAIMQTPKTGFAPFVYTLFIRNKGNTVWNEVPLTQELLQLMGTNDTKFFKAHLVQNPDCPQGKEIVLDEELEAEDW